MALWYRRLNLALILSFIVVSVAISEEAMLYRGYELPPFTVTERDGAIEMRRYGPHVMAEVAVAGDRGTAISRGFRVLAGYIFGRNAEGEKVDMTVPVAQMPREADAEGPVWTIQFMMPSQRSLTTLPKPQSEAIRFVTTEPQDQAVIRFSGRWTDRKLAEHEAALREWMAGRGLTPVSDARYYFYDGPFTLPMTRRNEVAFRVD